MNGDWFTRALIAGREIAATQDTLTSDDICRVAGEPYTPNQMGPVMNRLRNLKVIEPTDRFVKSTRPAAKGRNIQLWNAVRK